MIFKFEHICCQVPYYFSSLESWYFKNQYFAHLCNGKGTIKDEVKAVVGNLHGKDFSNGNLTRIVNHQAILPKTNSSPLKIGLPKRKVVSQPSIFRCYVSFRECKPRIYRHELTIDQRRLQLVLGLYQNY